MPGVRCSECNKFASYGEPEVIDYFTDINNSNLTGSVTVSLTCSDCGTQLKEQCFDIDLDLSEHISAWDSDDRSENHLEIVDSSFEAIEDTEKNKRVFGYTGTVTVTHCVSSKGKEDSESREFEIPVQETCSASEFEEV